jgi:phage-related protein
VYLAQINLKPPNAKPLRGFGGASTLEVIEDHDGNTYRAVYTVNLKRRVCPARLSEKIQERHRHAATRHRVDQETVESRRRHREALAEQPEVATDVGPYRLMIVALEQIESYLTSLSQIDGPAA